MTLYANGVRVAPTITVSGGGEPYLVEVSDKSLLPSWYRVYSDGWCEQGGSDSMSGYAEIELLKPLDEVCLKSAFPTIGLINILIVDCDGETATIVRAGSGSGYTDFDWEVKGYIAEE